MTTAQRGQKRRHGRHEPFPFTSHTLARHTLARRHKEIREIPDFDPFCLTLARLCALGWLGSKCSAAPRRYDCRRLPLVDPSQPMSRSRFETASCHERGKESRINSLLVESTHSSQMSDSNQQPLSGFVTGFHGSVAIPDSKLRDTACLRFAVNVIGFRVSPCQMRAPCAYGEKVEGRRLRTGIIRSIRCGTSSLKSQASSLFCCGSTAL